MSDKTNDHPDSQLEKVVNAAEELRREIIYAAQFIYINEEKLDSLSVSNWADYIDDQNGDVWRLMHLILNPSTTDAVKKHALAGYYLYSKSPEFDRNKHYKSYTPEMDKTKKVTISFTVEFMEELNKSGAPEKSRTQTVNTAVREFIDEVEKHSQSSTPNNFEASNGAMVSWRADTEHEPEDGDKEIQDKLEELVELTSAKKISDLGPRELINLIIEIREYDMWRYDEYEKEKVVKEMLEKYFYE